MKRKVFRVTICRVYPERQKLVFTGAVMARDETRAIEQLGTVLRRRFDSRYTVGLIELTKP